jgi:Bacteriophage tail sheath protein
MSPLPGVTYEERDAAGVSGPPLDTATAFIAGLAEKGPVDKPVYCQSLNSFEATFGGEVSYGWLWWAAKLIPAEGGAGCWFQRVVGDAAKASSKKLTDGSGNTLQVDAANPGNWGDAISVVTAVGGGNVTYTVKYNGVVVEVSPALATNAEAVAWSQSSAYVRIKDLGGADPTAQTVTLEGGADDRGAIVDADRAAALPLFSREYGAGQVLYPGASTVAIHTALLEHALGYNRTALLDGEDTHTAATHLSLVATLRALGLPAAAGAPFGPYVSVPGAAPGTTKLVPASIIEAAKAARRDSETYDGAIGVSNPNDPPAGVHDDAGVSRVATGLSQEPWTDAEREQLNEAGFNVIRVLYGRVVTYGYRTLANPVTRPLNTFLNNRRLDMAILARAQAIGEEFDFREVDGRGRMLGEFKAALIGQVLMPYWEAGALFGETPEEAFSVETGDAINPPEQLQKGIVKAQIKAKRSPLAEQVELIYVKEAL